MTEPHDVPCSSPNYAAACALAGFNAARADAAPRCPYLATSAAANAWHVGVYMRRQGWNAPTVGAKPREAGRQEARTGRGDRVSLRGYCDTLIAAFRVSADGRVSQIAT